MAGQVRPSGNYLGVGLVSGANVMRGRMLQCITVLGSAMHYCFVNLGTGQ